MCTVVLYTKVVVEFMLLCEIVSRSGREYCISSSSNLSNLSDIVPNLFGISKKVLPGTSDLINSDSFNTDVHD